MREFCEKDNLVFILKNKIETKMNTYKDEERKKLLGE